MTPAKDGRICGQCSKTIVDFSKMTWSEIEQIQIKNNYSVCGMYSQRQLEHWGQEVPINACSKFAVATALFVSLTVARPASSQVVATKDTIAQTVIHGTITGKTPNGNIDTLGFAAVVLKNAGIGVFADLNGHYQLDITNHLSTNSNPTLVFSHTGFQSFEHILVNPVKGEIEYNPQLDGQGAEISNFYIGPPTLGQRIKWKIKKWFRWRQK